jgi:hypothetical protein
MKLNRFETHDRYLEFTHGIEKIYEGCTECLSHVPEQINFPFYIYAHSRMIDYDEKIALVKESGDIYFKPPSERLIWMPVITKPKPSPNSYLFLVVQRPDLLQICWILPKKELWEQYAPGKMSYNEEVWTSIQNYKNCRSKMHIPDENGPTIQHEANWRRIFGILAHHKKAEKSQKSLMDNLYGNEKTIFKEIS